MAYHQATALLMSRLDTSQVITLYRCMQNRDLNPDQWDRQLKFWSELVKRWGRNEFVVQFETDELMKALMYVCHDDQFYPPLQPALDFLVATKVIRPYTEFVSPPSILSRVVGLVTNSAPLPCESYVFRDNLAEEVMRGCDEIASKATFITDVCIPKDSIGQIWQAVAAPLVIAELKGIRGKVDVFDNGFYVHMNGFGKPTKPMIASVLANKVAIAKIDKYLERCDQTIASEYQRAVRYKKQGRKQHAMHCLAMKRNIEKRAIQMMAAKDRLESQLHQFENMQMNEITVEHIKAMNATMKRLSIDDVDALLEESSEIGAVADEIGAALVDSQPVSDADIDREFEELLRDFDASCAPRFSPKPPESQKSEHAYRRPIRVPSS